MELTPWKPFREMEPFKREMVRLMSQFFGEGNTGDVLAKEWFPPLNVVESKENLIVEVELPGMEAKDIDVNLSGDILTIKGEKKEERKEEDKHYHRFECHIGSFQRTLKLPVSVLGNKVDAGFNQGILKITLPKTEEAKEREIKIKVH